MDSSQAEEVCRVILLISQIRKQKLRSAGDCECNPSRGRARAWAQLGEMAPEPLFQLRLSDHRALLSLWAGAGTKAREKS